MSYRLVPSARGRIVWLFLISMGLILVTWVRLAHVQIVRHRFYESEAVKQRYRSELLVPHRGTIFDRNGIPLAMTVYGHGVYASPAAVKNRELTAELLAPHLNTDAASILEEISRPITSVWLTERISPDVAAAMERLQLPGVYVVQRPQRGYPQGPLAADVLGFTGRDNQGLGGIEFGYDGILKGVEGKYFSERDPRGRSIAGGRTDVQQPAPGHDLVLTIDHVLQYVTEQELARGVAAAKAEWGLAVLLEPATGAIVASAVLPTFDPAHYARSIPRPYRNPVVSDQFEPGSTLKVFTAAAALEEGLIDLHSMLHAPPALRIGGSTIHCYNGLDGEMMSLQDALAVSCNTAFAQLGAKTLGGDKLAHYMRAVGFGSRLGIDLPGEGTGTVPTPGRVDDELLRWATVSFGQGIAVTPVQLAAATAVIANGGDLMQPYVVQRVLDADGKVSSEHTPTLLRRIISQATARDVTTAMEAVVEHGTGVNARVPGYRVAGKTGTAQIPEGGKYGDKRLASFIGFAPADEPALVLVIMLYDVQQDTAEGGRWAAPVFAGIMRRALPHIGIAPVTK